MLINASLVISVLASLFFSGITALSEEKDCVQITKCPAALQHLHASGTNTESMTILRRANCGFVNRMALVRCSNIPELTESQNGACISLQDCPAALRLIEARVFDPQVVNLFRSIHCGTTTLQTLIYCDKINL